MALVHATCLGASYDLEVFGFSGMCAGARWAPLHVVTAGTFRRRPRMRAFLFVLVACSDPGPPSFGDPLDDPQVPPRGADDILTWIEAGHYTAWACETASHPPRPGSGHGPNRICSNDALVAASDVFPIGAASVKEVFESDGSIAAYAVYRKMTEETGGDSWYWYEGTRDGNVANGQGDDTCTGCHGRAPRDFVYTIVE